ncbi:MAG TPA: acyl-CoA dehydrogenase family protein [Thermoguttaceae bacterium]|nr:acyl-CoA dehydrogenase family protein [Thermoguttaceae bacterium]
MGNYFLDNRDIQFLFDHVDLAELARVQEADTANGDADYVPVDEADAVDNYRRVLEIVGQIAADTIAPNAERVDREGNTLNDDGTVTLHPLVRENLKRLSQADLMGFILPRKYGGLNCPILIYTIATEIVSRGDGSFQNMFGLQGIAETVHAFASDEIKDEVLPRFASGEATGAMVLTEPDAGSDLQAVRLRADQDENGTWRLNGVKRFITNGCGEILLVLARSEPEISDGRGLSLFITERSERVRVRHLEDKLGIHGSPTCELVFQDAPARLVGERQRGLITYVLALMNGARVSIAAQSLGIAEAAYRLARTYAHTRQQFGGPIERLPAVAEMVTDMQIAIEAARALAYETSRICDLENNNLRILEWKKDLEKDEQKERKQLARSLKRLNGMLTPMSKYYCSETCCRVADTAIQVLGGSGYMRDYAAERHLRDARITTIYEGTSQLQLVAAVRGVSSGVFENYVARFEQTEYGDPLLAELKQKLAEGKERVIEAIRYVKGQSTAYLDLSGRRLVDAAIAIICGHLLLAQGAENERKRRVARRFIEAQMPILRMNCEQVLSGDSTPLDEYELLAGPVPSND